MICGFFPICLAAYFRVGAMLWVNGEWWIVHYGAHWPDWWHRPASKPTIPTPADLEKKLWNIIEWPNKSELQYAAHWPDWWYHPVSKINNAAKLEKSKLSKSFWAIFSVALRSRSDVSNWVTHSLSRWWLAELTDVIFKTLKSFYLDIIQWIMTNILNWLVILSCCFCHARHCIIRKHVFN